MHPKALIFDIDGTLAETEELHRAAFNACFADFGLDWHWDQVLYGNLLKIAGGQNRLRHFIETYQPPLAGDFIDQVADMHSKKTNIYGDMLAGGQIELRPGIEKLVMAAISKNLKLGISTSTSRTNVDKLFAATMGLNVLEKFDAICCGDNVEAVKPAPDLYLLALKQLGLSAQDCLAFEDSDIGLAAAQAAGIPTVITVSTYCRDDDFSGASLVMPDLETGGFSL